MATDTKLENSFVLGGALVVLLFMISCVTFLAWDGVISGDQYMSVVVGPVIGGLIGFVAGSKGVQQGTQAALAPPPPDA